MATQSLRNKKATDQIGITDAPLSVLSGDFAFDFVLTLRARPRPRSSVNYCTVRSGSEDAPKPGSEPLRDFEDMNRSERRRLLIRTRAEQPAKVAGTFRRAEKDEMACSKVIAEIRDLTGESISRGLATRILGGTETPVADHWISSTAQGELLRPARRGAAAAILSRVEALREKCNGAGGT